MITHRIHAALGIAVSTWRGEVSDPDLVPGYRALQGDDAWELGFDVLVDVREADVAKISGDGLRTVAVVIAGYMRGLEGKSKTAILAAHDAVFGLAA